MDKVTFKVINLQTGEVIIRELDICEFADQRATPIWLAGMYRRAFDHSTAQNKKLRIERIN